MAKNMFGRRANPIREHPIETDCPNCPNVKIAYPTFDDWVALYDVNKTLSGGEAQNRIRYRDMKRTHEHGVLASLALLSKQSTGRAVLVEIMMGPLQEVRILPYDFMRAADLFNTGAETSASNYVAASAKGLPIAGHDYSGKQYVITDADTGRPELGTGDGSSADIFFSPGRYHGAKKAEETLLHELVHASRMVRGVSYDMPVSAGYGNLEEFLAVTIANMYRAQVGRPLRDYQFNVIQAASFLDSRLRPTVRLLLGYMRSKQKSLYNRLADLDTSDTPFNPMRQADAELDALVRSIER